MKKLSDAIKTRVSDEPSLSGKFLPYRPDESSYILERQDLQLKHDSPLPIPPLNLLECWGPTIEGWLRSGEINVRVMKDILGRDGFKFSAGGRVMELGCATGRMLRWLQKDSAHMEIWGVDINAESILWCQQNLSPPFNFATVTTEPHLPFEDNYFDLIFAGSVFTHIGDLADAWLLEMRRLLKYGGRFYITINDGKTIEILKSAATPSTFFLKNLLTEFDAKTNVTSSNYAMFVIGRSSYRKGVYVFYNTEYLTKKLARWFDIRSVNEEAYGYQTAILLQKTGGFSE